MSRKPGRWLTYYFALPLGNIKFLHDSGLKGDFLISFAHFNQSDKQMAAGVEMARTIKRGGERVMLDSGAFTNLNKPGHVTMEHYCEFLRSCAKEFDEYIMLDEIGSRVGTIKNYATMRKNGFRPLFVDHLQIAEHHSALDKIWKAEPKVCLAGWGTDPSTHNQGSKSKQKDEQPVEDGKKKPEFAGGKIKDLPARLQKKVDAARAHKTQLHLLAVGSLAKFLPHLDVIQSVDSAVVFRCVGYGQILHCTEKEVGGIKVPILSRHAHPDATTQHHQALTPECKAKLNAFLKGRSFTTKINGYRAFCFHEITKYIDALNKLSQKEIMAAFDRHKQAQAKAEERTFFYFDDGLPDGWGMPQEHAVQMSELPDPEPMVLELDPDGETYLEGDDGETFRVTLEPVGKAVWSTAYVNDLPDSAFLYIAPGGEKDEDGKTTPRSLRYFPVRDSKGKLDLPHLRNALARIPQANIPQPAKDAARRKAQRLLEQATREREREGSDKEKATKADGARVRLLPVEKADEDRMIVFGVVLEPDSVDAQGDTIDAEEIERASHLWLARFQDRGLQHEKIVNSKAEIYESYIAPADLTMGGQKVKKGTWLLMLHVLDKDLWSDIKEGKFTGFSMGGFARRVRT